MSEDVLEKVREVYEWFKGSGFKLYIVGNQSRTYVSEDEFEEGDFDLATDARPDEMENILSQHGLFPSLINSNFGVVSFLYRDRKFEATTFRKDIYDEEALEFGKRYPAKIEFVDSAKEDVERRDFTINALYLHPKLLRVYDFVEGQDDLEDKLIRTIGDPGVRFKEDPVRMLRAVRFKYDLGFEYEEETGKALQKYINLVNGLGPGVMKKEMQRLKKIENCQKARRELKELDLLPLL